MRETLWDPTGILGAAAELLPSCARPSVDEEARDALETLAAAVRGIAAGRSSINLRLHATPNGETGWFIKLDHQPPVGDALGFALHLPSFPITPRTPSHDTDVGLRFLDRFADWCSEPAPAMDWGASSALAERVATLLMSRGVERGVEIRIRHPSRSGQPTVLSLTAPSGIGFESRSFDLWKDGVEPAVEAELVSRSGLLFLLMTPASFVIHSSSIPFVSPINAIQAERQSPVELKSAAEAFASALAQADAAGPSRP